MNIQKNIKEMTIGFLLAVIFLGGGYLYFSGTDEVTGQVVSPVPTINRVLNENRDDATPEDIDKFREQASYATSESGISDGYSYDQRYEKINGDVYLTFEVTKPNGEKNRLSQTFPAQVRVAEIDTIIADLQTEKAMLQNLLQ